MCKIEGIIDMDDFAVYRLEHFDGDAGPQLRCVFADFLKRAGNTTATVTELIDRLRSRIEAKMCMVLVGIKGANPQKIVSLVVIDIFYDWLGTMFAQLTAAWTNGSLNRVEKDRMAEMVSNCAKQLNVKHIRWQTKRKQAAMERWAKRLGYHSIATIFEKEV